jgi:hypothetical protein
MHKIIYYLKVECSKIFPMAYDLKQQGADILEIGLQVK